MPNNVKVEDFCNKQYIQFAVYQSYRTIASYIDGLKPSLRKVVYVVDKGNIKENIKISALTSRVIEQVNYLHGDASLNNAIAGLAANYVGCGNINLLVPEGNFGTRFVQESAAPRYIYTHKSDMFDKVFNKQDSEVLIKQYFEGDQIEYAYYVPTIPLILVNGSEGIGNGFAQKILPRSIKDIKKAIKSYLAGEEIKPIKPSFNGFNGTVEWNDKKENYRIFGKIEKNTPTTYTITELPIGYDLNSYIKVLNELCENDVIKTYRDFSEDDKFKFVVYLKRENVNWTEQQIYEKLKLIKSETENFTCTDENGGIVEFKNEIELLKRYVDIRVEYYNKRKKFQLEKMKQELITMGSKIVFIRGVVKDEIKVAKVSKKEIEEQISKVEKISKIDGNYDYLLNMPIYSLTNEKISELEEKFIKLRDEYKALYEKDTKQIWVEELEKI